MAWTRRDVDDARTRLRAVMPVGSTIYLVMRHISKSGMSHDVDVYTIRVGVGAVEGSTAIDLRWWSRIVAQALDIRQTKHGYVRVHGCGFDVGHDIASNLGHYLHGDVRALRHEWI